MNTLTASAFDTHFQLCRLASGGSLLAIDTICAELGLRLRLALLKAFDSMFVSSGYISFSW
jgi:hypothetical protein